MNRNYYEPVDEQFVKKNYIKRKLEEQEAKEEIHDYCTNEGGTDRQYGERPQRRVRGKRQ